MSLKDVQIKKLKADVSERNQIIWKLSEDLHKLRDEIKGLKEVIRDWCDGKPEEVEQIKIAK